jgi:uncharacterized cupredoxin-like copper-binding protein
MRQILALGGMLALLGVALSGCLGGPIDATAGPDVGLPPGHDEHHGDPSAATEELGPADVVLEAHAGFEDKDLRFHPGPFKVSLGNVVEIRVENLGQTPHTFTIHEFGADTGMMGPGEERTIKFRADRAGDFEIMCDAPGHYQAGMKDTLEVAA